MITTMMQSTVKMSTLKVTIIMVMMCKYVANDAQGDYRNGCSVELLDIKPKTKRSCRLSVDCYGCLYRAQFTNQDGKIPDITK